MIQNQVWAVLALLFAVVSAGWVDNLARSLIRIRASDSTPLLPGLKFLKVVNDTQLTSLKPIKPTYRALASTTSDIFKTHALCWEALPGVEVQVRADPDGDFRVLVKRSENPEGEGSRTFGFRRRLKMVLLPIMYKLGVITTLLTFLTIFSLKGLAVGMLLLILSSAGLLAKYKHHPHHGWSMGGWDPHGDHQKEVHVHVHPALPGGHPQYSEGPPPWHRSDQEPSPPSGPEKVATSTPRPVWSFRSEPDSNPGFEDHNFFTTSTWSPEPWYQQHPSDPGADSNFLEHYFTTLIPPASSAPSWSAQDFEESTTMVPPWQFLPAAYSPRKR